MKESEKGGASECSKVKYEAKPLSGMTQQPGEGAARCKTKKSGRECDETCRPTTESSEPPFSVEEEA